MSTTLTHDAFQPRPPNHWGPGVLLALAVHALLVVALAFSVNWHSSEPEGVVAELWSATPQIAAPRPNAAVEPPPPAVQKPIVPVARVEPPPPSHAAADAQIAVEQARAASAAHEVALKAEASRKLALARREEEREQQKRAAQQARTEAHVEAKALADAHAKAAAIADAKDRKKSAEEARAAEAFREANLRRIRGEAGTSDDPASTGTAARTSGPSASYAGRIKARVKPNIVLTSPVAGDPHATVLVRLAPDGTITGRSLQRSSGDPTYDDAVLRAIDRTGQLPRDTNGTVPSSMLIEFNPRE